MRKLRRVNRSIQQVQILALLHLPDVQLRVVVISLHCLRGTLAIRQILHVEEAEVEGGEVGTHLFDGHGFVAAPHVLLVHSVDE